MAKGKTIRVESTVEEALQDAGSQVSELRDEMSEWRDNLEDKFSNTQKYQDVSDCADTLDGPDFEGQCEALLDRDVRMKRRVHECKVSSV